MQAAATQLFLAGRRRPFWAIGAACALVLVAGGVPRTSLAQRAEFGDPRGGRAPAQAESENLLPPDAAVPGAPSPEPPLTPPAAGTDTLPGTEPLPVDPQEGASAPPSPKQLRLGVFGTNVWAGRGMRRVASAYSMPVYSIGLNVGLEFFSTKSLFVTGDTGTESIQQFALAFSPAKGLELAISGRSLAFQYRDAKVPRNLMLQGNPGLQLKYGHHVAGPLALGARASVVMPASASGSGISFNGVAVRGEALLSVQPFSFLEWTTNLGYVYDRGAQQYARRTVDAVQRFVYGIHSTDRVLWSSAVQARFGAGRYLDITPFVEFSGEVGLKKGATASNMPTLGSIGVRLMPTRSRAIEATLGSDVMLTGNPQINSPFGGVPPYQVFAQLSVHFHDWAPAVRRHKEPLHEAVPIDAFTLRGSAFDKSNGRPVQGLRMVFVGEGDALLTSNPADGRFVSWPLPRAGKDLQLHAEAPGYIALDEPIGRPPSGDANVALQLTPSRDASSQGTLKGTVRHAYTAQPVAKARVEIEGAKAPLSVDRRGAFSASLRPGSYRLTVKAPGFLPQYKTVIVAAGEGVVFNVDLEPTSR